MKTKLRFLLTTLLITGFCSILSPILGIVFWKGLILSIASGVFTMTIVVLIDTLAKFITNGKQNTEAV